MDDWVIVFKSGVKLEIEGVDWSYLRKAINEAFELNPSVTFMIWENMALNIKEVAVIYKKGTGVESV